MNALPIRLVLLAAAVGGTLAIGCGSGDGHLDERMQLASSTLPALRLEPPGTTPAGPLPELPREFVDTRMPVVRGQSRRVRAGERLQDAIDDARPGDEIVLDPGATYTGPFTLRAQRDTGWIIIRSAGTLPAEGTRMTPAHAAALPRLVSGAPSDPVIRTEAGARQYRLVGLEITVAPTATRAGTLVALGTGARTLDQLAADLVLDRLYIHGTPAISFQRCVALNSGRAAIIDSWLSDCHGKGMDSQAIAGWSGTGPYKIVNNFLEGAGENVMFGGADPTIPDALPRDIEIRRNHFYKPPSWKGVWTVKNILELKVGQRVLVEGNVFENNWAGGQTGFAIVMKSTNQGGRAPWSQTSDVTFRYNVVRNVAHGFTIAGRPEQHPAKAAARFLITQNVLTAVGSGDYPGGRLFMLNGVDGVAIDHNTALGSNSVLVLTGGTTSDLVVTNNIFGETTYGILGDGRGSGEAGLTARAPGWIFKGNVMAGASARNYPADNAYPPSTSAIGFANAGRGDLRLHPASRYGRAGAAVGHGLPPGADMDAVREATEGVVVGAGG
ncbi:MAG TPA: hypothetical protein VHQ45_04815 [Gemmatimonadaceae bacterium]|nr:hypothetical protein [Gemmatimonadaceae bacterium]